MRRNPLFLILLFAASPLFAQTATLVKDINASTNSDASSSSPKEFFRFGSRIYFSAYTPNTGVELFSTDGTEAGTSMVANIYPGTQVSRPSQFTDVNGHLIFNAVDSRGEELWTTDGTSAGTRIMADMNSGATSSFPGDRIVYGGRMIFAADDGPDGRELWITDGTPAGTRFFKDLVPGPNDSDPRAFTAFNGAVYFAAAESLWKTDGTEAGTVVVKTNVEPYKIVVAGSRLFFPAYSNEHGVELWTSDGTDAGTQRLTDITPGPNGSVSYDPIPFGNRVLFLGYHPDHGTEWWISDGTAAGTQMLLDIYPGQESGASFPSLIVNGGIALFSARTPQLGYELWKTDGTPAGTVLLRDFAPGPDSGSPAAFVNVGSSIYFATADPIGARIWVTDGTDAGTRPITTQPRLTIASPLTNIDGTLYFSASNALNGFEPWKSDGTDAGTSMIANVSRDPAPSSEPRNFRVAGDWIYFDAWDGFETDPDPFSNSRHTLWRTDGTPEGTVKVLNQTSAGPESQEYEYQPAGHTMLFRRNRDYLRDLWITDGTAEGTKEAEELQSRFREPAYIQYELGDTLFVSSDAKLWTTKLSPGSPVAALDSDEGALFAEVAGRLMYFSRDGDFGKYPLWISDGTAAGTYIVKSLGVRGAPVAMGGQIWFTTFEGGSKLWKSDGTADGTLVVKELPRGGGRLVAAGRKIFFTDGVDSTLWVTDGTAEGTRELPAKPAEGEVFAAGDKVVFAMTDTVIGREPWVSDGTPEGTKLLLDIRPGTGSSSATEFAGAGAYVYFTAYTDANGSELWITDGTPAGTKLAADIDPGTESGYPVQINRAGDRLYFSAFTAATGREVWTIPLPPTPRFNVKDVRVTEGETTARFTITLSPAPSQSVNVQYETSNGTASAGSDYDANSGTLTFAAGETSKTVDVRVRGDASVETNETFSVTLRNPSGAILETSFAAGIIEDDDHIADVALALDFQFLQSSTVLVDMKNAGPATATNLRPLLTATPVSSSHPGPCSNCRLQDLAPDATARAFEHRELGLQQYLTATVTAREPDPNPSNNVLGWTSRGSMVMEALHLTPGSQANVWFATHQLASTVTLESSDPSVVTVPPSVALSGGEAGVSFLAHGVSVGTATVRAFITPTVTLGTLVIDVIAPGTTRRWPGAVQMYPADSSMELQRDGIFRVYYNGTAPFTGERATGAIILTAADGHELARAELLPDVLAYEIPFRLTDLGKNTITAHYTGDANFLPITAPYDIQVTRGRANITATATRTGTDVVVRMHLSGSPAAAPTGTVRAGTGAEIPLVTTGPGLARAEVTLHDVPESTSTLTISYSGDQKYVSGQTTVGIRDERRRTTRH